MYTHTHACVADLKSLLQMGFRYSILSWGKEGRSNAPKASGLVSKWSLYAVVEITWLGPIGSVRGFTPRWNEQKFRTSRPGGNSLNHRGIPRGREGVLAPPPRSFSLAAAAAAAMEASVGSRVSLGSGRKGGKIARLHSLSFRPLSGLDSRAGCRSGSSVFCSPLFPATAYPAPACPIACLVRAPLR